MSVNRIRKLDIHNRPFLTAIYGITGVTNKQECFIEPNLVEVNRWQELYLYLKEENYDTLFYNKELGFWGYEKQPLRLILKPTVRVDGKESPSESATSPQIFIFECSSPNAANRKKGIGLDGANDKTDERDPVTLQESNSQIQSFKMLEYGGLVYNLPLQNQIETKEIVRHIRKFAQTNPEYPLAIVIDNPQNITWSSNTIEEDITGLINIQKGTIAFNTRLLILYDVASTEELYHNTISSAFFCSKFIIDFFRQQENEHSNNPSLFCIGNPERKEYENWLNRIRINGLISSQYVFSFPYDKLVDQIILQNLSIKRLNDRFRQEGEAFFDSLKVEEFSEDLLSQSLSKIHGQEDNISVIKEKVVDWLNEPEDDEKRPLNLMFAGPTGTGKTYTAKQICKTLKSRGYAWVYIKMNQYTNEADTWRLFGSTTGHIGSNEDPKIIAEHKKSDRLVILFDEFEKAHPSLYSPLMNLLDEGIVENGHGKDFDLRKSIIIFTTNLAQGKLTEKKKELIQLKSSPDSPSYQKAITEILIGENRYPPEFWGRFSWFFVYNRPSKETVAEIVIEEIRKLSNRYGITINNISKEILLNLTNEFSESPVGMRPMKSTIKSRLSGKFHEIKKHNEGANNEYDITEDFQLAKSQSPNIIPVGELASAITQLPEFNQVSHQSDEDILSELYGMVGLRKVKESIEGIIADVKAKQIRAQYGQTKESKVNLSFVFKGNPGTGKTTVAQLLGRVLVNYGLISNSDVVKYTKGSLIDGYVGGGSRNVEKMFEDSVGKVLFIDEAYQLADDDAKDAKDAITNMLTDPRFEDKLAVVLAGYPGDMAKLISSNPGLKSRFTQDIFFEDYTNDDLTEIFRRMLVAENFIIAENTLIYAKAYFASLRRNKEFGNAREAKNLRDKVKKKLGTRLLKVTNPSKEEAFTIIPEDFPNFDRISLENNKVWEESKEKPVDQLNKLIGIDNIRKQFEAYVEMAHYCQEHPQSKISATFRPHMAFLGNPGTGKSTVARLFAEILRQEGLLTNSNFVEVGPADLIGEFLGQSGPKARSQFERARGGVLFIDEAYQLCRKGQLNGGDQYGKEVITELIKFMEDDRNTVVILAGYTDEIRYLIKKGNPGLASRVTNEFIFEDYTPEILFDILLQKLSEYEMSDDFKTEMLQIIENAYEHRGETEWGNARTIENYAAAIFKNFLKKYKAKGVIGCDSIPADLCHNVN